MEEKKAVAKPATKKRGNPNFGRKKAVDTTPKVYRLNNQYYKIMPNGTKKYPVTYILPGIDVIYDIDSDTQRTIRYIPGESSVFADEQSENSNNRKVSSILFTNGSLVVPHTNPLLRTFLDLCNRNGSNPNKMGTVTSKFELYNPEKEAKVNIERTTMEIDAQSLALKMPLTKLIGYAKVLGVNTNKSTDEIRYDMKIIAQQNPEDFLAGIDDPRNETKQVIFDAADNRIINIQDRQFEWVKGNTTSIITTVPLGVDNIEYFVDLLHSDEGKDVLDSMKKRLKALA